jgi:cytochrome c-type biogenesis protein CcmH
MNLSRKLCLLALVFAVNAHAVIETYDFASPANEKRYQVMVDELRCPKCQNQNLAGSNSPIAKDLRRELHRMIEQGESDENIKAFMVKRYGNFVLYRPPLDKNTLVLWVLPAVMALLALLVILLYRLRLVKADTRQTLTEEEQQTLKEVLDQYSPLR